MCGRRWRRCRQSLAGGYRNDEPKYAAFANRTADRNGTSEQCANPLTDGQSKARTAVGAGNRAVGLGEMSKQDWYDGGRNANTGILDLDLQQEAAIRQVGTTLGATRKDL